MHSTMDRQCKSKICIISCYMYKWLLPVESFNYNFILIILFYIHWCPFPFKFYNYNFICIILFYMCKCPHPFRFYSYDFISLICFTCTNVLFLLKGLELQYVLSCFIRTNFLILLHFTATIPYVFLISNMSVCLYILSRNHSFHMVTLFPYIARQMWKVNKALSFYYFWILTK